MFGNAFLSQDFSTALAVVAVAPDTCFLSKIDSTAQVKDTAKLLVNVYNRISIVIKVILATFTF